MVKSSSAGFTLLASCILFIIIVVLNLILYLILLVYLCKAPRGLFWYFCAIQAPHIIIIRGGFKTQLPVDRRFRPISIVLNNDNRPEPDGTAGQPAVGF